MLAQDYHLVCAQPEVISNFHRLHNGDEKAHVGKWAPVNFDDAPDLTKRRTVLYTSQLNIPTWLRKILGAPLEGTFQRLVHCIRIGVVCSSTPNSAVFSPGCRVVLGRAVNCNVHVWPQHKLCSTHKAPLKRVVNPELLCMMRDRDPWDSQTPL